MGKKFWNRITGITKMKREFAKTTGIPTTKEGRKKKFGWFGGRRSKASSKGADDNASGGCCGCLVLIIIGLVAFCWWLNKTAWDIPENSNPVEGPSPVTAPDSISQ